MLDLRVLQYYLVVAKEESLTKAASILHISQPTLSRQLHQLEDQLGKQLFVRGSHNITLTESGVLLCKRAEELLELSDKTETEFANADLLMRGEISIGCGELKSFDYLAEKIRDFRNLYSDVTFQIYSGNADQIRRRMDEGLVDIGLLLMPVNLNRYEFVETPVKERMGILIHRDSPLAEKQSVDRKDLANVPLMAVKRLLAKGELYRWFGKGADRLSILAQYNLVYNSAILAKNKLGAVVCLELDACYNDLVFVPLKPVLELSSVIVWKKFYPYQPAAKRFIEYLRRRDI